MPKDKVEIRKSELPKARRSWGRSPTVRIKNSGKIYKRPKIKQSNRKVRQDANKD